jgi:4-hydroxymandelate oxidase
MAAAAQDANMILSAISSTPMEDVVAAGLACRCFQFYVQETRERTLALVRRAERAGFEALVVIVDAPVNGSRNRV